MRVLVTGATGFTGSYVVPALLKSGAQVRCLVRASSDKTHLQVDKIEFASGDLEDEVALVAALRGVDALVNIASLGFGHAPNIVNAALEAGVKRAIFVSTTAVFTQLNAPSKVVRLAAEETIKNSGLDFTILRPTMIYGSSRDRNMCRLIRFLARQPVIPIIGSGEHLQQPVYVGDVAAAAVQSLSCEKSIGGEYNISGAAPLSYNDVIDTVCAALKRRVRKVHLPVKPVVATLGLLERLPLKLPLKAEQILRLNENKAFDFASAARDFEYAPRTFDQGIALELHEMKGNAPHYE